MAEKCRAAKSRTYSYYSRLDIFRGDNSIGKLDCRKFLRFDNFPPSGDPALMRTAYFSYFFISADSYLLDSRISSKHHRDTRLDSSLDFKASCEICKKKFRSSATLQAHFISPRHLWKLERFMMTSFNGHSTDTEGEPMSIENMTKIDPKGMTILYFVIVI